MKKNYNKTFFIYFLVILILVFSSQIFFIKFHIVDNIIVLTLISSLLIALIAFLFFKIAINKNNEYINNLEIEFEELTKSNERYDIVAKATSDTIWDWDLKTGSFIWNKGIENIFGYKKEDVGENLQWWFDKIHPEDSLKMSVKLYSFIAEKSEKWQDEYRFCCADGSYKYIFDRGFLVKDESENIVRMIGAMQDVTKQKEEEQRLKLLETVIIQTKDSVVITEGTGINSELPNIVYVNPAFSKMTGFDDNEVIGASLDSFMNGVHIKNELIKLEEALKKKEEYSFESINTRKNGEEYWVNFIIIPITDKENQHSHWISIQRDISVEKEREKEREALISELTQNNKDLKQFSYITSHNLRAPLSNLTGLLNLIEDVPIENEELKEIINGFSKSTNQLNETINDLVNVIIIKDSPSIQKEDIVIRDVFENVFSQLSFLISLKKPIIKIDFHDSEIINLNKSYIESILLNLMTNSLRYFDPKKQLKITISSKKTDLETVILFKDNGIGIDMDRNKDKIFGLYQRFHDYPDSKGLGLYLVKSQVESMGGKISIESQVGVGTTFTITFKNK